MTAFLFMKGLPNLFLDAVYCHSLISDILLIEVIQ